MLNICSLSFLPAPQPLEIQITCPEHQAVPAGRLSATVFKLELELKSLKSSQGAKPLQQTQTMHAFSDENTAAQLAALIRKAAAAQEAADSAQQQLSQATQAHAEQLAGAQAAVESTQQELSHTSRSLTQLQQELAAARQGHADQVAVLQKQHADQVAELQQQHAERSAAVTTGFNEILAVAETELSESKSSFAFTKEQHAKSLAELQQCFDSQLATAESKRAVMLAASHTELAAARQHNIQLRLDLDQSYKTIAQPLHSSPPHQAVPQHSSAVAQAYLQLSSAVAKHPSAGAKLLPAVAKLSSAVAAHPSDEAPFQTSAASSSLKAMPPKQHGSQAAADTIHTAAQDVTAEASECTALRQSLTALEKQLAQAQAEILVHASTSVGRFELLCRLKAAAQGSQHYWTATDHVQQMQQLMQSVAGAVRNQKQADHTAAVAGGSQNSQQHAVTSASRAKEEHGSADDYPSDEDDLDDWTQEGADDDSDADYAVETGSMNTAAGASQNTWIISAGVRDCSSSNCSSSLPKLDLKKMPDAASPRAELADASAPEHARQGSFAGVDTHSSAQMSSRSLHAASVAVSTTAVDLDVVNSHPIEQLFGAQVKPAADPGMSSVSDDAGFAEGGHGCEVTCAGVADIDSSLVTGMHPSEENDLDDWTCDDDGAYAVCSCAVTSGDVVEARSSSVVNDYPSDEDDLDDWTQEDEDTLFE